MATTKVLLRDDIETLGGRGEIVKVRAGYARNYLLPQGLATLATKGNIKQVENERTALLKKAAVEKSTADAQADQMKNISLAFERKAGDNGILFGSVTSMDIAEALKAQGYEIDRRKIVLKDAIKETGDYTVTVKLHREVPLQIPITVKAEGAEETAEDGKKGKKAKGEKTSEAAEETAGENTEA
jgi:large subunit ribosomal protein L9